jgi:hypothetical protein
VQVDRERAWAALQRDKKRGLVLPGEDRLRFGTRRFPTTWVRAAFDELIA